MRSVTYEVLKPARFLMCHVLLYSPQSSSRMFATNKDEPQTHEPSRLNLRAGVESWQRAKHLRTNPTGIVWGVWKSLTSFPETAKQGIMIFIWSLRNFEGSSQQKRFSVHKSKHRLSVALFVNTHILMLKWNRVRLNIVKTNIVNLI